MNEEMKSAPWVWIRGLARESAHWGDFVQDFKRAFPDKEIFYIDIPGSGENRDQDPKLTIQDNLPFLREQLQNKMGRRKFNFFSISLGSMFALEWMNQFPGEILSAVLINPSSKKHSTFYERLRPSSYAPILKALTASTPRKSELAILDLISNRNEIHKDLALQWAKIAKERPLKYSGVLKQLAMASRYSPPDEFPESIPVLVLVGLGDRMVEPKCGLELAEFYGWEVKSHPWAGHDLTTDDPQWVINALSTWAFNKK
jgi:pimeloyl-ACP methyl ester carboxylesterase